MLPAQGRVKSAHSRERRLAGSQEIREIRLNNKQAALGLCY